MCVWCCCRWPCSGTLTLSVSWSWWSFPGTEYLLCNIRYHTTTLWRLGWAGRIFAKCFCWSMYVSSTWPTDFLWHCTTWLWLVQMMAWHLLALSPFQPIMSYCQLNSLRTQFNGIWITVQTFLLKKSFWRCHVQNDIHFIQASMC